MYSLMRGWKANFIESNFSITTTVARSHLFNYGKLLAGDLADYLLDKNLEMFRAHML